MTEPCIECAERIMARVREARDVLGGTTLPRTQPPSLRPRPLDIVLADLIAMPWTILTDKELKEVRVGLQNALAECHKLSNRDES